MIFTFDGIKEEIKTRLKDTYPDNWAKSLFTGVYERLIDFMAYISEKIVYTGEIFYREANYRQAQKRESIMSLIEFLPYRPHGYQGSSGNVQISADPTFDDLFEYTGASVIIPRWHRFETDEGDIVYCYENTVYPTSCIGNLEVSVKEGNPREFIFIANGDSSELIEHFSDSIDTNEFELFVVDASNVVINNIYICDKTYSSPIGIVDQDIYFVNDLDNYYCEIRPNNSFTGIKITFGDGIRNKKLSSGLRILLKYAETEGANGNITAGKINIIKDDFNPVAILYVRNDWTIGSEQQGSLIGGTDIEDIESIRENGRRITSAGDRCGNNHDWITILNSKEYIAKSVVWALEDIGLTSLSEEQNKVFVTAIDTEGKDLTTTIKQDLQLEIRRNYKTLTEIIQWVDSKRVYLKIDINADFKIVSETEINQTIKDTINSKYDILKVDFSEEVPSSNIIALIDNLENIIKCDVNLYHMEKEMETSETAHKITVSYQYADLTPTETSADEVNLYQGSTELWLQYKRNGIWDVPFRIAYSTNTPGDGDEFISEAGWSISGSAISYVTNAITYVIDDLNSDSIPVINETLTLDGLEVDDTITEKDIVPLSFVLKDNGVLIPTIETDLLNGTGTIKDDITPNFTTDNGTQTVNIGTKVKLLTGYSGGGIVLHIYDSLVAQGSIDLGIEDYSNITNWVSISIILGDSTINYSTGELVMEFANSVTEPITCDYFWGTINPDDSENNGFIISLVYKTCDGLGSETYNGNLTNSIRLPKFYHIVDVDTDYIFNTLEFIVT